MSGRTGLCIAILQGAKKKKMNDHNLSFWKPVYDHTWLQLELIKIKKSILFNFNLRWKEHNTLFCTLWLCFTNPPLEK